MRKDFFTLTDLTTEELSALIKRAVDLKAGHDRNACPLIGKNIGLLFEKPSTRTRVSFEAGIYQLGGNTICLNPSELQLGRGETIADTARALSRYLNGIVIRTFGHSVLKIFSLNPIFPISCNMPAFFKIASSFSGNPRNEPNSFARAPTLVECPFV